MLSNSGKPWTATEEQDLILRMKQCSGDMSRVAELHRRSRHAIEIRLVMIADRMSDLHHVSRHDIARQLSVTEETLERLLGSRHTQQQPKTQERQHHDLEDVTTRLSTIERLLRRVLKKIEKATPS
jgi:hypothetical protein